jgi:shikimate dehydrogenase
VTIVGKNMLVNATPTGMAPGDGLPADLGPLRPELFVADIVPTPEITPLLALARSSGCSTMNGQAMVAGQAEEILRFFRLVAAD